MSFNWVQMSVPISSIHYTPFQKSKFRQKNLKSVEFNQTFICRMLFNTKYFLNTTFFRSKIFFIPNTFFRHKIFVGPKKIWTQDFFFGPKRPKKFLVPSGFYLPTNYILQQIYLFAVCWFFPTVIAVNNVCWRVTWPF